jgi:hypothetical protein
MENIKYVCGAELAWLKDKCIAVYPMALCDTALEAAKENTKLHSSFGFDIYEVDASKEIKVMRQAAMAAASPGYGFKILKNVGYSFDILKEAQQ